MTQMVKNLPAVRETLVQSLGWEDSLEEDNGNHLQYSCLENPVGQRSWAGYSPWDLKGSDTTEWLKHNNNGTEVQDLNSLTINLYSSQNKTIEISEMNESVQSSDNILAITQGALEIFKVNKNI